MPTSQVDHDGELAVTGSQQGAGSLVVGYNVTHAGDEALELAADLAAKLSADLHIVHVIDLGDVPFEPDTGEWSEKGQKRVTVARRHAKARMNTVRCASISEVVTGDPAHVLEKAVQEHAAMMLVVGADRPPHNLLRRLFWHDASKPVIRLLPCPIVVVPGH